MSRESSILSKSSSSDSASTRYEAARPFCVMRTGRCVSRTRVMYAERLLRHSENGTTSSLGRQRRIGRLRTLDMAISPSASTSHIVQNFGIVVNGQLGASRGRGVHFENSEFYASRNSLSLAGLSQNCAPGELTSSFASLYASNMRWCLLLRVSVKGIPPTSRILAKKQLKAVDMFMPMSSRMSSTSALSSASVRNVMLVVIAYTPDVRMNDNVVSYMPNARNMGPIYIRRIGRDQAGQRLILASAQHRRRRYNRLLHHAVFAAMTW